MRCRAVNGMVLALALVGCAQGRSAQAPPGYDGHATLTPLRDSINAGLSPEVAGKAGTSPSASQPTAVEAMTRQPVGLAPLPAIRTAINGAGLNPPGASPGAATAPATAPAEPAPSRPALAAEPRSSLVLPSFAETPAAPPALVMPPIGPVSPPDARPATVDETVQVASAESESESDTKAEPEAASLRDDLGPGRIVGLSVATVDGEHITLAELITGVDDYRQTYLPEGQSLSNEERDQLAGIILQQLVDRTLLTQEAKRRLLTNEQKQKLFFEHADTQWREQEIPRLCRQNKVSNEFELREALEKRGRSLDMMHETFRKSTLAREFLHMQLQARMSSPGTPQHLTAYYRSHLNEFQLPAQITWREIVVPTNDQAGRAEARKRAEALLDQLRRGADFAALAALESKGPTASRGGLWETEPGASIAPAVNEALERLPLRQVSPILEGPGGFHIVRVEARRAAGPKPFKEVQGQIFAKLQEQAFQQAAEKYIQGLRERAIVTSRFEGTASAPAAMRDSQAQRASAHAASSPASENKTARP